MNVIFFVLVALFGAVVATSVGLPRINAITAFAFMWTPLLIVASLPDFIQPALSQQTWNMIWLALAGVVLGGIVGALPGSISSEKVKSHGVEINVNNTGLVRCHLWLTVALSAYAAIQIYKLRDLVASVGGWSAIFSTSGIDFRRAQLDAGHEINSLSAGILVGASYVLFLGFASLATGAILWRLGRNYIAILPILVTAVYSILVLQRTFFFMSALIFTIIVLLLPKELPILSDQTPGNSARTFERRSVVAQLMVLGLTAVALLVPLYFRNTGDADQTGTSPFQYLMSGIVGLSRREQLGNLTPDPGTGFGSYTFTLIFRILDQLGLPLPVSPAFYEFYNISVAGVVYPTNTGTSILDFRLDFGMLGIFAMFFLIAFGASFLQKLDLRRRIYTLPITSLLLVTLFWSFFVTPLFNDFKYQYAAAFACYLLSRLVEVSPLALASRAPVPPAGSEWRVRPTGSLSRDSEIASISTATMPLIGYSRDASSGSGNN